MGSPSRDDHSTGPSALPSNAPDLGLRPRGLKSLKTCRGGQVETSHPAGTVLAASISSVSARSPEAIEIADRPAPARAACAQRHALAANATQAPKRRRLPRYLSKLWQHAERRLVSRIDSKTAAAPLEAIAPPRDRADRGQSGIADILEYDFRANRRKDLPTTLSDRLVWAHQRGPRRAACCRRARGSLGVPATTHRGPPLHHLPRIRPAADWRHCR